MRPTLFLAIGFLWAISVDAQTLSPDPVGTWRGSFQPPAIQVPLVLQISRNGGGLLAKTQSPNQKLAFDSVDSIVIEKTHISYSQNQFNLLFSGTISGNIISGAFSQGSTTSKVFLVHVLPDESACSADLIVGEWRGTFEFSPSPFAYVLTIAGSGANMSGTVQTPSLGPNVYPVDAIAYSGNVLSFRQGQFGVSFTGTVTDKSIAGTIIQNGYKIPIVLQRF